MSKFKIGLTYETRSACDQNCVFSVVIQSRTAKTVTTAEGKKFHIFERDGVECIKPMGNYSMAPVIKAV